MNTHVTTKNVQKVRRVTCAQDGFRVGPTGDYAQVILVITGHTYIRWCVNNCGTIISSSLCARVTYYHTKMTRIIRSYDRYKMRYVCVLQRRIHESSESLIVNNNYRLLRYVRAYVFYVLTVRSVYTAPDDELDPCDTLG